MLSQETAPAAFEEHRPRLRAVAYRMLGSFAQADEAVREALRRLDRTAGLDRTDGPDRTDYGAAGDPGRRLITAVGRVSLDMLRARPTRSEPQEPENGDLGPEERALLADTADHAVVEVLDTLTPAERLAFVLHDLFSVPIDEIAPLVDRTPAATRQLAARARRRTQGLDDLPEPDPEQQREVVTAFLAAARGGDVEALTGLLDPDAVLRTDETATAHGAQPVARALAERAAAAVPALVNGVTGLVLPAEERPRTEGQPPTEEQPETAGQPRTVLAFTVLDGRITAVDLIEAEPHRARVTLAPMPDAPGTA
ncbi:sigma factor-like helix-turn-helix DNA-binding protein [Streptomyces tritici]|uniref:sigma factor-like helix-turn-helix DNA-binding protein n=1 Tax=Streptomyces tritici TaxID=2054410 RepID=UPI003AF0BC1F